MRGALTWLVAFAAVSTALLALGARRPSQGGALRLPVDSPVQTLDPLQALTPAEVLISSLIYDTPYRLEGSRRPSPHLLTPVAGKSGGAVLRLEVRPHALFHDGTPLRASHVVSSLQRLAGDPQHGWLLAMLDGWSAGRSELEGIKLVGGGTVQLRLRSERAKELLLHALATPRASVVPSKQGASRGVGSGPFIARSAAGRDRLLRGNRDYFDGPPYLTEVRLLAPTSRDDHIRQFQLERSDASLLGVSVYGERPSIAGVTLTEGPPSAMVFLLFNAHRGATRALPLRRAIDLALDRRRLAGSSATPLTLPGSRVTTPDVERAKILAAGLGLNPSSRPLLLLVDGFDTAGLALAAMLQRDLAAAGIPVERVSTTAAEERARLRSGSWDLRLRTISPLSPNKVITLGQILALGGLQAEAAQLLQKAPVEGDAELARAIRRLESELPLLPLLIQRPRLHSRAYVRDLRFDIIGRLDLADVWLRERRPSSRRSGR